jgi:heat shock protein HslJ
MFRQLQTRCAQTCMQIVRYVAVCALFTAPQAHAQDSSPASLENTYWKLLTLRGNAVHVPEGQPEPHLILQPLQKRVVGFSGCSRMLGTYTRKAQQLTLHSLAGTRMACPQGRTLERDYLAALKETAQWQVQGQRMMLLNAKGKTVAEFEAVYLQ